MGQSKELRNRSTQINSGDFFFLEKYKEHFNREKTAFSINSAREIKNGSWT